MQKAMIVSLMMFFVGADSLLIEGLHAAEEPTAWDLGDTSKLDKWRPNEEQVAEMRSALNKADKAHNAVKHADQIQKLAEDMVKDRLQNPVVQQAKKEREPAEPFVPAEKPDPSMNDMMEVMANMKKPSQENVPQLMREHQGNFETMQISRALFKAEELRKQYQSQMHANADGKSLSKKGSISPRDIMNWYENSMTKEKMKKMENSIIGTKGGLKAAKTSEKMTSELIDAVKKAEEQHDVKKVVQENVTVQQENLANGRRASGTSYDKPRSAWDKTHDRMRDAEALHAEKSPVAEDKQEAEAPMTLAEKILQKVKKQEQQRQERGETLSPEEILRTIKRQEMKNNQTFKQAEQETALAKQRYEEKKAPEAKEVKEPAEKSDKISKQENAKVVLTNAEFDLAAEKSKAQDEAQHKMEEIAAIKSKKQRHNAERQFEHETKLTDELLDMKAQMIDAKKKLDAKGMSEKQDLATIAAIKSKSSRHDAERAMKRSREELTEATESANGRIEAIEAELAEKPEEPAKKPSKKERHMMQEQEHADIIEAQDEARIVFPEQLTEEYQRAVQERQGAKETKTMEKAEELARQKQMDEKEAEQAKKMAEKESHDRLIEQKHAKEQEERMAAMKAKKEEAHNRKMAEKEHKQHLKTQKAVQAQQVKDQMQALKKQGKQQLSQQKRDLKNQLKMKKEEQKQAMKDRLRA